MKYTAPDASLFVLNRKNFAQRLKPKSIAIFNANDEQLRSGDQNFAFKQNPDLYYLSGIDQEQSILILFPDCPNPLYREVLFLRQTNDHIKVWEGHKYTKEGAQQASGIQQIFWLEFANCRMNQINRVELLVVAPNRFPGNLISFFLVIYFRTRWAVMKISGNLHLFPDIQKKRELFSTSVTVFKKLLLVLWISTRVEVI